MDAEDYRDHLPCPGSVEERQAARIRKLEDVVRELVRHCYKCEIGDEDEVILCETCTKALELVNGGSER